MIERWFPCAEVSEASAGGWGSGKSEKALFTWFAARPLAQAKAAVITSLLPWPDEPAEQARLKDLVRRSLTGRDAAHDELVAEVRKIYPNGASLLDIFSGRAMIPLEAARLGVRAWGIDYSPVATLAGLLLADYPLRDWSAEPQIPFGAAERVDHRLVGDVKRVLDEIGRRYEESMAEFYPKYNGRQPWGYLWAVTLPCQECTRRFPITGSLVLREPLPKKEDPGQSYKINVDKNEGTFSVSVHDGEPTGVPTMVSLKRGGKNVRGKVVVCPFCDHVHSKDVHTRLAANGLGRDVLLVASDLDDRVGKHFRETTSDESSAAAAAIDALAAEEPFGPDLPAIPNEPIPPGNSDTVRPSMYGAKTYGDLCNARQTLGFVRLTRIISIVGLELRERGISPDYAAALCGYAGSVVIRKLKYSTRGVTLFGRRDKNSNRIYVAPLFRDEASIGFSYDYFETALGDGGSGTWPGLVSDTIAVLRNQATRPPGRPAQIQRGSALALPMPSGTINAVVTDPPYDNMIDYSDASDLFYVWLKRALVTTHPDFAITADPRGVQEKAEEIIVKRGGSAVGDHRTEEHYKSRSGEAFAEARRVVEANGVVTIVFGHGEPEVWHRLLESISHARLLLTGSWAAKTEVGAGDDSANIVTTLTLACRPAPANRPVGRVNVVDDEVRQEVHARVPQWTADHLALTDQLMASAGPAMEVVGRYENVLDSRGEPVDLVRYLYLARRAVEEAAAIRVDELPLDAFDKRTRFALFWAQLFGRGSAPKSEARWQGLASDLSLGDLEGKVLVSTDKVDGMRLAFASEVKPDVTVESPTIDVAFALASAWADGLQAATDVLAAAGRDGDDTHLWSVVTFLCSRLPDSDPDKLSWTALVRARRGITAMVREVQETQKREEEQRDKRARQTELFERNE
jgi:adenine-specific DNA methylase